MNCIEILLFLALCYPAYHKQTRRVGIIFAKHYRIDVQLQHGKPLFWDSGTFGQPGFESTVSKPVAMLACKPPAAQFCGQ
jgi:hypothetical protein